MARRSKIKFNFSPDRPEYERQPQETSKSWKGFLIYRDLGFERTLIKAAGGYREACGITNTQIQSTHRQFEEWSRLWSWRYRIEEWERELDRHRRKQAIKDVENMRDRHVNIAKDLQTLGTEELRKWLRSAKKSKDASILVVVDILKAIEAGVKLERASLGEPDSVVETRHQITSGEKRDGLKFLLEDPEALTQIDSLIEKVNNGPYEKDIN